MLWPITIVVGILFLSMLFSMPISLVMSPSPQAAVLTVGVGVVMCAFFAYVLRGLVRALRGDDSAQLVPSWLVLPLALVFGLSGIALGVAGVVKGQSSPRAASGGVLFLVYGYVLWRQRRDARQAASTAGDAGPSANG